MPGQTDSLQGADNVYVSVSLSKETKRSLWIGFMLPAILTVATLGSAPWRHLAFPPLTRLRFMCRITRLAWKELVSLRREREAWESYAGAA